MLFRKFYRDNKKTHIKNRNWAKNTRRNILPYMELRKLKKIQHKIKLKKIYLYNLFEPFKEPSKETRKKE